MPELPEVETIVREIAPFVKNKTIVGLEVIDPRNIKKNSPEQLEKSLKGKIICGVERRAKYIVFVLSSEGYLVVHLGMTGRLLFKPDNYVKLAFVLSNGEKLYFSDARLFGKIWYYKENPELGLGPEPLTSEFTPVKLQELCAKRKTSIKVLLLNQKALSGVGNIYANEALFRAKIHPQRPAGSLTPAEIKSLHSEIENVIEEAIKYRGTSDNWYVDAKGQKGEFQERLKVYGRKGKPCFRCGGRVLRISHGHRGTFFCPECQK